MNAAVVVGGTRASGSRFVIYIFAFGSINAFEALEGQHVENQHDYTSGHMKPPGLPGLNIERHCKTCSRHGETLSSLLYAIIRQFIRPRFSLCLIPKHRSHKGVT